MPRPIRRRLQFDEDSVNKLLQEIYDESHNIKAKITRLFTKWELKVKEGGEIAAIGDQIVKLIAAEAKNQDQKIMLLKYLKEVVFDNYVKAGNSPNNTANSSKSSEESGDISAERRLELLNMVQEHFVKKEAEKQKENE
ncbi:MAG: hypothetical protein WC428_00750 [Candidatus Paceibacterota bacterium]|jgi:hypothetical protein